MDLSQYYNVFPKLIQRKTFNEELKIIISEHFSKPVKICRVQGTVGSNSSFLSVRGKGEVRRNEEYIVFCVEQFNGEIDGTRWRPRIVKYLCTVYILDTNGEKVLPKTFRFDFYPLWSEISLGHSCGVLEERYIERKFLLENELEYLVGNTLTVLVETAQEEWASALGVDIKEKILNTFRITPPMIHTSDFAAEEHDNVLKVYLCKYSASMHLMCGFSKVFQDMWDILGEESGEERVQLKNEELPAFLCMLFTLSERHLILYEVSIFDLYIIADKYDVPWLVEECRKYIEKYLPEKAPDIVEFAITYNDKDLQRTAESSLQKHSPDSQECTADLEACSNSGADLVWDTRDAFRSTITSKEEFLQYWNKLLDVWENILQSMYSEDIRVENEYTSSESFDFYS